MSRKDILSITILCIYAVLVIFSGIHHEPWRDEAHGWYTARENSIPQLIRVAKYERVPILWYLVLMPFAKLGLPYVTMTLVSITIAIYAVGILLFFGEIPFVLKILFIFSYYMTYEYAVIARNYVLVIALLFSIAVIYKNRFNKSLLYGLLIFLLYQVNVFTIVPGIVLTLCFAIEIFLGKMITSKRVWALVMMIVGGVVTIAMLLGNPVFSDVTNSNRDIAGALPVVIGHLIIPTLSLYSFNFIPTAIFQNLSLIISGIIIILSLFVISRSRSVLFMAIISYGWLFYINTMLHVGSHRHHGLIIIFLLFFWWISNSKKYHKVWLMTGIEKLMLILLSMLLLISLFYTVNIYRFDYKYQFSGAYDMAVYIKNRNLERITIVSYPGGLSEAVLPYFKNKQFWFPEYQNKGITELNSTRYAQILFKSTPKDAILWVRRKFYHEPVLLIWNEPLSEDLISGYTLLHNSPSVYFWGNPTEDFWLYANESAMEQINSAAK